MKAPLLSLLLLVAVCQTTYAQIINSHRLGFHYRLKPQRLEQLAEQGIFLTSLDPPKEDPKDPKGATKATLDTFALCRQTNVLRVLIKNDGTTLLIDPWTARNPAKFCDTDEKPNQKLGHKRIARLHYINENTKPGLQIKFPKRERLGSYITKINLSYQTLLFNVNAIAFKTRPGVTDYNGTDLKAALVSGNFNLGLSAGYSFGWSTFTPRSVNTNSLTFGAGVGFSSAHLRNEPLTRYVDVDAIPPNFIFSPTGTVTVARNDIGFILALGMDHMAGNAAGAWAYQNKLFFGFGISTAFKL
jgi:hypothetical protein